MFRFFGTKLTKEQEEADDEKILSHMGYSQELFRGVTGSFMNFAFTFTAVSFISSYSILFGSGLYTGGPAVMTWGWFIGSIFSICVGLSMAEICSSFPSAGSVYHWTGQLANPSRAPFISFICGYFNFLGNVAGDASFASGFAQIVAAAAVLNTGGNGPTANQQVGISIAVLFLWSVFNIARIDQQGWVNNVAAVYQVVSSFVIIIVVLSVAPTRATGTFVFATYNNETGLNGNAGYVSLIGLLSCLFAFSGYEAGGHIAEETKGARLAAPRGIVYCVITIGIVGFIYVIGLLFAVPDIDSIAGGNNAAIVNLYQYAAGNKGGLGLTMILIFNLFFAGMSSVTVTSRITFALARDGAFPGSKYIQGVSPITKSPIKTVFLAFAADFILLLLPLINTDAFIAIVSLCTIGYQISYAIPIWCRIIDARNTFPRAEFHLGRASIPIGFISASWLTITSCLFFWPSTFPVNKENMNYTVVVVGGVLFIALVYWFASARHWFTGPKRRGEDLALEVKPEKLSTITPESDSQEN